jgi:hypothetical protein
MRDASPIHHRACNEVVTSEASSESLFFSSMMPRRRTVRHKQIAFIVDAFADWYVWNTLTYLS